MNAVILGRWGRFIGLSCVGVLWLPQAAPAAPLYSVVPIGPPSSGDFRYGYAGGINDLGQVVGTYVRYDDPSGAQQTGRAFQYSDVTATQELPWPSALGSSAVGVNNSGQIALTGGSGSLAAYQYTPAVGYQSLGSFGGSQTEAYAINNAGQVTGFSESPDGPNKAYRYTVGTGMQNIGTGYINSDGMAINDRGWVAGFGDGHAVLFRDEGNIDLGPGIAYGLNNAGDVVGYTTIVPGHPTAFAYLNGQMLILADDVFGQPRLNDINGQGVAVGLGFTAEGPQHALLWTEADRWLDLNSLVPANSGWTLLSAVEINELGQITGTGFFDGTLMPYRLDPVPEPSIWALFGLGAAGLWTASRYQKGRATSHVRKA